MKISTRGRYALRVMIELAEHGRESYIPMKEVAQRQGISLKYLEKILPVLSQNHLIEGVHGKGGGYRLCREPEAYTISEILRLTEGNLAPVSCLETGCEPCKRHEDCRTIQLWSNLYRMIGDYLDSVTLADLMKKETKDCILQE